MFHVEHFTKTKPGFTPWFYHKIFLLFKNCVPTNYLWWT